MRTILAIVVVSLGCANHHHGAGGDGGLGDGGLTSDACVGLRCYQVDCAAKNQPTTSLSGTVFAPNGTLPLYGVNVYVPAGDPGPLADGVQCDRCNAALAGDPIAQTKTDEAGHFSLPNVPATSDVPIVIQVGKWRKRLTVPNVAACQDTALTPTDTRLPKDHTEGDLPKIAITTGNSDALECLVRKIGIADSEITTDSQSGRVHLFYGNGAAQFAPGFAGGTGAFSNATSLWGTVAKLSQYDVALFSCEGGQVPGTKPQSSMQAVHDYAGLGGRIFMSHWHNIWIGGESGVPSHGLADWESIATWAYGAAQDEASQLTVVDETAPKGMSFATWLMNVGASTVRDHVTVNEPRYTCQANDPMKSERWVYVDPALSTPAGKVSVQDLLFTTPQDVPPEDRCGKVVFSDMHVSSGSTSAAGTPYPGGCSMTPLSAQEKALAFIFFDISSCVGSIF
ncbi:MAG: hypothetical protein JWO36_644 [Myxococcales bacterium]|nr:hypothetical protein [Myxococcales bacterium]